jgi:hypothetical protein
MRLALAGQPGLARQVPRLRPPPGDGGAVRAGVYTVGLYDSPDATETDHGFPLPVIKASPFAPPPKQPSARI